MLKYANLYILPCYSEDRSLLNYLKRVHCDFRSSFRKNKARGLAYTLSEGLSKISGSKLPAMFC